MLGATLDRSLAKHGFKRPKRSTTYKRQLTHAVQEINVFADFFPRYEPTAEAHLHAHLILKFPELSEQALRLVDGNVRLLGQPEVVMNEPIEFAAPKDVRRKWYAYNPGDYPMIGEDMYDFIEKWVVPLLEKLQTPDDLIKIYETNDKRIIKQHHWYIYVVAAFLLKGDKDSARQVMETNLGRPGLRKIYAAVYDNLAAM